MNNNKNILHLCSTFQNSKSLTRECRQIKPNNKQNNQIQVNNGAGMLNSGGGGEVFKKNALLITYFRPTLECMSRISLKKLYYAL